MNSFIKFCGWVFIVVTILAVLNDELNRMPNKESRGEEALITTAPVPPVIPDPISLNRSPQKGWLHRLFHYSPIEEEFRKSCDYLVIKPQLTEAINTTNSGYFNLGQVCDIYDYLMDWNYVQDPYKEEYFEEASQSWQTRTGDCDDFAIVLATALYSIGGYSEIMLAHNGTSGHAYAQVCLGPIDIQEVENYIRIRYQLDSDNPFYSVEDEAGNWYIPLDWSGYPGSPFFDGVIEHIYSIHEKELYSF